MSVRLRICCRSCRGLRQQPSVVHGLVRTLLSQVAQRVDGDVTPANFEMAVMGASVSGTPDPGNGLALADWLAGLDQDC